MPTKGWKSYRDFFLKIEPAGEGSYRVSARAPGGGAARANFVLPFDEKDIEIFLLRIGQPKRLGTRGLILQPAQPALDFGNQLFNAVFKDEVRDIFVSARNDAERKDYGLRLRLRLEGAPELADLPWEYLYDSPDFLALSTTTPLVRYIDLPSPPRPLAVDLPLRVLVTVSSPHGLPKLDIDAEKSKIKSALADLTESQKLELSFSQDATLQNLQRSLRRARSQDQPYHAWHFIGHGIFDPSIQAGQLALCNAGGMLSPTDGFQLGTLFRDYPEIRLILLNACEGARNSRQDPFAGVAAALVERGIPAVIGMQFEISDEAAIVFSEGFYTALVDGLPVDAALTEARRSIFFMPNWVEWATPVLFMRSQDGVLFKIQRPSFMEQADARRLAEQKAEEERLAAQKAEQERVEKEKAEAERVARKRAEAELLAIQAAEQERLAREQADAQRLAKQKAEEERLAQVKAERERLAALKAERERFEKEKAEAERLASEQAEAELLAIQNAKSERSEKENVEAEHLAAEKAERESLARERDESELITDETIETEADLPIVTPISNLLPGEVRLPHQSLVTRSVQRKKVFTITIFSASLILLFLLLGRSLGIFEITTKATNLRTVTSAKVAIAPEATKTPTMKSNQIGESLVIVDTALAQNLLGQQRNWSGNSLYVYSDDREDPAPTPGNTIEYLAIYIADDGSSSENDPRISDIGGKQFPIFSPTGDQIAYGKNVFNTLGQSSLIITDKEGSKRHDILTDELWINGISWSPDGKMLAIGNLDYIKIIDVGSGSVLRKISTNNIEEISWSPDGYNIAYLVFSGKNFSDADERVVKIVNLESNNIIQVTDIDDNQGETGPLLWTPDGLYLTFNRFELNDSGNPGYPYQRWIVRSNGADLRTLERQIEVVDQACYPWYRTVTWTEFFNPINCSIN